MLMLHSHPFYRYWEVQQTTMSDLPQRRRDPILTLDSTMSTFANDSASCHVHVAQTYGEAPNHPKGVRGWWLYPKSMAIFASASILHVPTACSVRQERHLLPSIEHLLGSIQNAQVSPSWRMPTVAFTRFLSWNGLS